MLSKLVRKFLTACRLMIRFVKQRYLRFAEHILPAYSIERSFLLLQGRVFDEAWYAEQNKDLNGLVGKLSDHYFGTGIREGRAARFFDAPWYKATYPDQVNSRLDAWSHYCQFGFYEHRQARFFYVQSVVDRADIRRDYSQWLQLYESKDKAYLGEINQAIQRFKLTTHFQIELMVERDLDLELLKRCLASLKDQRYGTWNCRIFFSSEVSEESKSVVRKLLAGDSRFELLDGRRWSDTQNFSEPVAAKFICMLSVADCLSSDALFWMAMAIHDNPNAKIFYADEDILTVEGERVSPKFKPEFNYELLLSHNYLGHFVCYEQGLFSQINLSSSNTIRNSYESILQAFEKSGGQAFFHIPRILNHCQLETASIGDSIAVLQEHFKRMKTKATVTTIDEAIGYTRVKYALPTKRPLVSIIIPTRDRVDLLSICVDSVLKKTTYENYEIIIVDNGSKEAATFAYFEKIGRSNVEILRDSRPFNFSALNNDAVSIARGEYVCLMNNDIEVITPEWIEEMLSFAVQRDVGCVGARLWYPDKSIQHAGVLIGFHGVAGHMHKFLKTGESGYMQRAVLHQSLSAVTAALLMVRKSIFDEVGGLDETLAVAFNDVDLCLKVRDAGYRNIYTPYVQMFHHESASRGPEASPEKRAREASEIKIIKDRYGAALLSDPAYNPNLSLVSEDLSLAFPPRVNSLDDILKQRTR